MHNSENFSNSQETWTIQNIKLIIITLENRPYSRQPVQVLYDHFQFPCIRNCLLNKSFSRNNLLDLLLPLEIDYVVLRIAYPIALK